MLLWQWCVFSASPVVAFITANYIVKNSSKHMKTTLTLKFYIENSQDFLLILETVEEIRGIIYVMSLPDYKWLKGGSTCWKACWQRNPHFLVRRLRPPSLSSLPWGVLPVVAELVSPSWLSAAMASSSPVCEAVGWLSLPNSRPFPLFLNCSWVHYSSSPLSPHIVFLQLGAQTLNVNTETRIFKQRSQ